MLDFFYFHHIFLSPNTSGLEPPNGIFFMTKETKIPKKKGGESMSWEGFWQWISHWFGY